MIVQLGGLEFRPTFEGAGLFYFSTLVGWYDVSESKSEIRERPQAHGAFGLDQEWRESLLISLEGAYVGDDIVEAARAKRTLKRALAQNVPVEMLVTDPEGPTSRVVSVRNLRVPDDHGQTRWRFSADVIALDPRRYGPEVVTSTGLPQPGSGLVWPITYPVNWGTPGDPGRITVANPGDEETVPLLEVAGGLDGGFELVNVSTGQLIRFERHLPAGSTVFVDMEQGLAYIDDPSNDVSAFLTRREFWTVPAGESFDVQFGGIGAVTGTPILTARTRPAY